LYIPWMIHEGDCGVIGQRHFVPPQIPHDQVRFRTPDRSGGKPATNRLSYGAALVVPYSDFISNHTFYFW
jgi:hypothetical protein